ncbi:complex I NDUFA9 subunit family protein [Geopsychrobacter electrodiphilus]|uniref:complex I NDUFA9 subunit family protein n=1 Tax=Geopsychrobacter electrodiphilus TaxID=225196 RepID=UPI000361C345|nr:complex I NDUFA9 subunit family protein [Geopsychrobacter electrodiphilus]
MDIFLTGGSGFVGRALCRVLIGRGHSVKCLVRVGSEHRLLESPLIKPVPGDLLNSAQLAELIPGCGAVIQLVGIIREFPAKGITFNSVHRDTTISIVAACQKAGIKRYLHMSANGTRDHAHTAYHRTKWQAEETVRNSDLDWTIFRPSLIYGEEDQFITMISGLIRKLPLVPVIGDGSYRLQPVPVETIAAGFANALSRPKTIGKIYHCGGADCLSYDQLLDEVGRALGKPKVRKLHHPLALMEPLVELLQHLAIFPLTSGQLKMLLEGNCCDNTDWLEDLDLTETSIRKGFEYLKQQ